MVLSQILPWAAAGATAVQAASQIAETGQSFLKVLLRQDPAEGGSDAGVASAIQEQARALHRRMTELLTAAGVDLRFPVELAPQGPWGDLGLSRIHVDQAQITTALSQAPELQAEVSRFEQMLRSQSGGGRLHLRLDNEQLEFQLR